MSDKLTKSEIEYMLSARPRSVRQPGYFDDDGKFHKQLYYKAYLGKQGVGDSSVGGYIKACGGYGTQDQALTAARVFQTKIREMFERGEYVEPKVS